ncbi:MAG: ABC transporter ATP-binding protein [Pseudomonadota bacterium]
MTLLTITDLSVEYPSRRQTLKAVDHASLTVEPGEIHGLVGESGAGKSTIGAAVLGLLDPPGHISGGQIGLHNSLISGLDAEQMRGLRGKKISMIFQDPLTSLNPLITIRKQLVETIITHLKVTREEADQRAFDLIDRVGIPDPATRLDQYPHQFSGGMRQRVVIALALCSEPEVIIADEPTTALDVAVQAQILDLIKELARERKVGIILITHDMGVIADTTDRVTVMYGGKVVESGPTADIMGRPQHPYTKGLIAVVPRPNIKLKRFPQVTYGGRENVFNIEDLSRNWPKPDTDAGQPILKVENLTKVFGTKGGILSGRSKLLTAVDDVSFEVWPGEVFGLVGESGSGKSTIARMIAGLYEVDGGTVTFEGENVSDHKNRQVMNAFRRKIQMIFQDPYSSLNPRMRVVDIVSEPMRHLDLLRGKAVTERAEELLERVGLGAEAGEKYPHQFSGGQLQRISIARALATQPTFLICDEPTSALDVSIQAQILNILKDLQQYLGVTMLFISHDLPVVRQMCDRVAVMKDGKLVEMRETNALFSDPQSPYTKDLLRLMPRLDTLSEDGLATE